MRAPVLRRAGAAFRRTMLVATVLASTAGAAAQGRVTAASSETRRVTQSLNRELNALTSRRTDAWVAYRLTTLPNSRHVCGGSHIALEPSTQVTLMLKLEAGALRRLRVFTPECDIDTGSVPLVWLEGIPPDDSANWLTGLIRQKTDDRDWRSRVADPALSALALHTGDQALRALISLAKDDDRVDVRRRALAALGDRAGQQAAAAITGAVERDPEIDVKKTAVAALGRLPKDEGVPLLISVARTSRNGEVRREAMRHLAQSNDARAVRFFEDILKP